MHKFIFNIFFINIEYMWIGENNGKTMSRFNAHFATHINAKKYYHYIYNDNLRKVKRWEELKYIHRYRWSIECFNVLLMIIQNVDFGRIFMLHNFLKIPWYDTQCTLQNQLFTSTSVNINIIIYDFIQCINHCRH